MFWTIDSSDCRARARGLRKIIALPVAEISSVDPSARCIPRAISLGMTTAALPPIFFTVIVNSPPVFVKQIFTADPLSCNHRSIP